jgi:hypothetical protein
VPWTNSSPLLCLPTEILISIFVYADIIDRFALALTCKKLLQISSLVTLKTSVFIGQAESNRSCITRISTMEQLLRRVKPLTTTGLPTKTRSICIDCLQYRLTKKSYWEKKAVTCNISVWRSIISGWNNGHSLQCPECCIIETKLGNLL